MTIPSPILSTHSLRKRLGRVDALAGLDLSVPASCVCGFLGRNGAGKTTAIKILMGMMHPGGGEACVFGLPAGDEAASVQIRQRIGFVAEVKDFYPFLTVAEMIAFARAFSPHWRADWEKRCVDEYRLEVNKKAGNLSKGNRSKLALLLAFSRGADLLILDEPAEGLDPAATEVFLQHVVAQAAEGHTIFFSSHQLTEVERVCDRVCLIDQGHTLLEADLDEIKGRMRRLTANFSGDVPKEIFSGAGFAPACIRGRGASVLVDGNSDAIAARAWAAGAIEVETVPVSLRDLFLETVGGQA